MSKHKTRREAESLGKAIAAALVDGGVITSEQAKSATITVGGHKEETSHGTPQAAQ